MVAAAASTKAPPKSSIIKFQPRKIMLGKQTMKSQKEKSGKDVICSQERGNILLLRSIAAYLHTKGFSNTLSARQSEAASEPKTAKAFQRVKVDEVKFQDERLQDNSFWAKPKTAKAFQRVKVDEVKFQDERLQDNSFWAKPKTAKAFQRVKVDEVKFQDERLQDNSFLAKATLKQKGKGALGAECDYLGSPTNLIMVTTTSLMLFAGRFGLVPSANRKSTAGLKLEVRESGLQTGDPVGFTLADTLACGSVGHIMGVGIVLGLKNIGVL